MATSDYTTTFIVEQSPKEVFDAINNVSGWWNAEVSGDSHTLHGEFEVKFADVHYSKQKVTELVPAKKVCWLVTDSKLSFLSTPSEWTGTTITFEISQDKKKTKLRFTHLGLLPKIECYEACSTAWADYLNNSLLDLITTGTGQPFRSRKKAKVSTAK